MRAVFYGLGADGTVGANKNSIKIIGEETDQYAQGYFVYDSKKSGAITISHLRFGPRPIQSSYLIRRASFVAVHQWNFFERYDVLEMATPGGTLLVNSQFAPDRLWDELPREVQERIIELGLKVYTVDALDVAHRAGMGGRINTVMQTCFFALAKIFPREEAIGYIKRQIKKTYGAKGEDVVNRNYAVVDDSLAHLHEIKVPATASSRIELPPIVSEPGARFRQAGDGRDPRRQGRLAAGERVPDRRHLADGDLEMGEAQPRAGDPGLGSADLHPVQQVRDGVPARGHPRQGLPGRGARGRAGHLQVDRVQGDVLPGRQLFGAGGARGLHRLHAVRRGLPGQGQEESAPQGDRHGRARAAARRRARQLRILPGAARGGPHQGAARREGHAVLRAAVRVLGRLRGCGETPTSSC